MREQQFDQITRLLAHGISRRDLLKWVHTGLLASLASMPLSRVEAQEDFPWERLADHLLRLTPFYKKHIASANRGLDVLARIFGYLGTIQECVRRGHSAETCQKAAELCAVNDGALLLHPYIGAVGIKDIFGAFKRNCGDGKCFQCCWTNSGCHTSFIGFPRINCNKNYGPETAAAGITLITDPNAQPGDACLSTLQTCSHLALCIGGKRHYIPPSELVSNTPAMFVYNVQTDRVPALPAETPPNEWIASQKAIDSRALTFASQLQTGLQQYLAAYTTELTPDDSQAEGQTVHDLAFFLFGRGRPGWAQEITYSEGWRDDVFLVQDESGQPVESASKRNAAQLLGITRLLSSVPNLTNRLAAVESRVWSDTEIDAYIARIGDVDTELLRWLSPHALELLKRVMSLQYYGLLAVPLIGEAPPGRIFDGFVLGKPPQANITFDTIDNRGIAINLSVIDSESSAGTIWPVSIDWGDGQVTSHQVSATANTNTFTHTYDRGGGYLVVANVTNDSGLRGIAATLVKTKTNEVIAAPARIPMIARAILDVETTFFGEPALQIDAYWIAGQGEPVLAGRSGLISSSETSRTTFAVANPLQQNVQTLRLMTWYGNQPLGTPVLTIAPIAFDMFSTVRAAFVRHKITIPLTQVQAYYNTPEGQVNLPAVTQAVNGVLSVPMRARPVGGSFAPLAYVDLILTPELFANFTLPTLEEVAGAAWKVGESASQIEERPGQFVEPASQLPEQKRVFLPFLRR